MDSIKKINIPLIVGVVIALALFLVGCFYDKSISESLYNSYQLNIPWFTIVITILAPLITNTFGAFAGSSLIIYGKTNNKKLTICLRIFGVLGLVVISFFAYTSGTEFADVIPGIDEKTIKILYILTFLVIVLVDVTIFLLVWKKGEVFDKNKLLWVGTLMLFIIACTAVSNEIIKYLASRPRPRIVFPDIEKKEAFKQWFEWRPFYGFSYSESKSFISGHSSNAASITFLLPLFLSLTRVSEKKHYALLAATIGVLYSFVISLSRVFAIAHFMTDIAGGLLLSYAAGGVVCLIFIIIKKKTESKSSSVSN